ncbi:MAG: hypothetical protein LBJ91_07930 [Clostridiales Family XIII bacterium]|jgi:hypothetical protein|nr:hypothetical protein [Clostridiales Family XIII bacterium]
MDSVWNAVIDLRPVILVSVLAGAILLVVAYAFSEDLDWTRRRMKIFGAFFGLRAGDALWLSAGLLRISFVVAIVAFCVRMEMIHMVFYAATAGLSVIFTTGVKNSLLDLVNTVVAYAALTVLNIIFGYYRDVNGDPYLLAIYCLLGVFVALYLLYFYIRGIGELMLHKIASGGLGSDDARGGTRDGARDDTDAKGENT